MFEEGKSYICIETINNIFSMPIYRKGDIYKVMWIDEDHIIMDHILYANEYIQHRISSLENKFKSV